jgi:tetratricopeptide (TPR) repeat protein
LSVSVDLRNATAGHTRPSALDPLSPLALNNLAVIYVNARQFDRAWAIWQDRPGVPRGAVPLQYWGEFLLGLGEVEQALDAFETAQRDTDWLGPTASRARALAVAGRTAEARALLSELSDHPDAHFALSPYIARAYGALGEIDEAFRWLETALEHRAARLIFVKVDPAWDRLRGDPRFGELLRRMNLGD